MRRVLLCGLLCAIFFMGTLSTLAGAEETAKVVAKVNGEDILQSDVDFVFDTFVLPQFKAQNPDKEFPAEQMSKIEQNIINQLVTQTLVLQEAAKLNITVDDAVVSKRFEEFKAQRPDASEEQIKPFISKELLIQQTIQQEVADKVEVSDEEVKEYYEKNKEQFKEPEQVQASHILVQVAPDATQEEKDAAKQKIDGLLAQVKEGKDFAEVAKESSDCPSKEQGGDLGFFPRGAMVKPFEDVAFALNEGEISDVVETQFGYHIIKLTAKKASNDVPFEDVKERLQQGLLQQKKNSEVMSWFNNIKTNATIEMMNEESVTQ